MLTRKQKLGLEQIRHKRSATREEEDRKVEEATVAYVAGHVSDEQYGGAATIVVDAGAETDNAYVSLGECTQRQADLLAVHLALVRVRERDQRVDAMSDTVMSDLILRTSSVYAVTVLGKNYDWTKSSNSAIIQKVKDAWLACSKARRITMEIVTTSSDMAKAVLLATGGAYPTYFPAAEKASDDAEATDSEAEL